jgi:hypothetical protein
MCGMKYNSCWAVLLALLAPIPGREHIGPPKRFACKKCIQAEIIEACVVLAGSSSEGELRPIRDYISMLQRGGPSKRKDLVELAKKYHPGLNQRMVYCA